MLYLNDSLVYLFSGTKDVVVRQGVMEKTQVYYEKYMPPQNILTNFELPVPHAVVRPADLPIPQSSPHAEALVKVTDDWGSACPYFGSPFINNCSFNMAGEARPRHRGCSVLM